MWRKVPRGCRKIPEPPWATPCHRYMRALVVAGILVAATSVVHADKASPPDDGEVLPSHVAAVLAGDTARLSVRLTFDLHGPAFDDTTTYQLLLPSRGVVTAATARVG